jgi:hypothetical protein
MTHRQGVPAAVCYPRSPMGHLRSPMRCQMGHEVAGKKVVVK